MYHAHVQESVIRKLGFTGRMRQSLTLLFCLSVIRSSSLGSKNLIDGNLPYCSLLFEVFGESCNEVNASIVQQVIVRSGFENECIYSDDKSENEFCGYSVQKIFDNGLWLQHRTEIRNYIDDIHFVFEQVENKKNEKVTCGVTALSQSQTSRSLINDHDRNYCNIFNLLRKGNATQLYYPETFIEIKACEFHPNIDHQNLNDSVKQCNLQ